MGSKKHVLWVVPTVLVWTLAVVGCSMPTGPSGAALTAAGATTGIGGSVEASSGSPEDFANRGWECRNSPVPGRVVCSHPNQGFPAVPPPEDRPATYQLRAWQDGAFAGNIVLIRPDLYHNQPCDSTGDPYIFRPVIGYYECLQTVGQ